MEIASTYDAGSITFSVVPAGLFHGARNPGLRPGLSSAVPPGLDLVMVVLTQTLKP
jgi:hypothetical protein